MSLLEVMTDASNKPWRPVLHAHLLHSIFACQLQRRRELVVAVSLFCDSRAGQDVMQDSPVHQGSGESSTSSWRDNMAAAKKGGRKKGGARKSSGRKSSRKSSSSRKSAGRKSGRKGGRKSSRKSSR
jgi:hypothetical protein